jgi:hypothetical protein
MGMFLRRVLKFLVIIIGSFLGAVFLVIQWMQARQYIQGQVDFTIICARRKEYERCTQGLEKRHIWIRERLQT